MRYEGQLPGNDEAVDEGQEDDEEVPDDATGGGFLEDVPRAFGRRQVFTLKYLRLDLLVVYLLTLIQPRNLGVCFGQFSIRFRVVVGRDVVIIGTFVAVEPFLAAVLYNLVV